MTTVLDVSSRAVGDRAGPSGGPDPAPTSVGRLGPLFAGIWLFFLLNPLLEGWSRRDEAEGVLGIATTLAFAAVYMTLWVQARADRQRLVSQPRSRWSLAYVGALVVLGRCCIVLSSASPGLACAVYVSVACVMVFPFRVAAPIVVALTLGTLALGARSRTGAARSGRRSGSWPPRWRCSGCAE